ncbi:MAG: hypothetical protein K0R69_604 [Clostridia bacterium]|nr:hypothetical protein [Clostridia bacterium]
MRLIICDDEKIMVDSIKYTIDKQYGDIELETARNGREAIEKADLFKPDMILMDIKMPGINGIEAVKKIKENLPQIIFIIISAYEHFEYVKDALSLGVIEYIVKPMNKSALIEAIEKGKRILAKQRGDRQEKIETREKLEAMRSYMEHNFIYSIIFHNIQSFDYNTLLDCETQAGFIITLEFKMKDLNAIKSDLLEEINNQIKYKYKCIIGPLLTNRMTLFVPGSENRGISQCLQKIIQSQFDIEVKLSIGNVYEIGHISTSYEETIKVLSCINTYGIVHVGNLDKYKSISTQNCTQEVREEMTECIKEGEVDGALSLFDGMYQKIAEACSHSIAYTKSHMIELIIYIFNHMAPKDTACLNSNELVTDLLSIDNFRELDIYMRSKIVALCKSSSIQEEGSKNKLVTETKKYIEDHYNEDISLEELAKEICVSPNYLSRLFRDKTGENYIEYLTNIRINKAKELMLSTEMSVKEISYNIGYNDPNYFSRLFKKIEKVSPSEYVKYALSTQGVKS